jgi:hypothetical protein
MVFRGSVAELARQAAPAQERLRVRLNVEVPQGELRPGMAVAVRCRTPVARLPWYRRNLAEQERDRLLADLAAHGIGTLAGPAADAGLEPLFRTAVLQALLERDLVPAVPESSVIDTGSRKVVYVEHMAGMFDAVEVVLGHRCGEFYPVLRGLEPGDPVVATGALLLDAQTRLDPRIAASYFGARRPSTEPAAAPSAAPNEDQALIARQKVCPVTGEELGSMGPPVGVVVEGRKVFVCCKSCVAELKRHPEQYLSKLAP